VRAALAIRDSIAAFDGRLVVKLGLHTGPGITVNLNDRLDYFGTTVNMAARLQAQSRGGDIVLSRRLADDPAVRPLLAKLPLCEESLTLKGFDAPVPFIRIAPHN
jgi:class 3 adenylate cyclase